MNGHTLALRLGQAYRRVGSLVSVRAVRDDDRVRAARVSLSMERRVARIEEEVLRLERVIKEQL